MLLLQFHLNKENGMIKKILFLKSLFYSVFKCGQISVCIGYCSLYTQKHDFFQRIQTSVCSVVWCCLFCQVRLIISSTFPKGDVKT